VLLAASPALAATSPKLTGLAPAYGPAAGGTSVAITGTNLQGTKAVNFGAKPAQSFTVSSTTSVTAVSPPGTGVVDVVVTTPSGTSPTNQGDKFDYGPTVAGLSPTFGPSLGGTTVTISGTNFTGATSVDFGANPATGFIPTGTITYSFFSNGTCSGTPGSTEVHNLSNGQPQPANVQGLPAGSYSYEAAYSGDSNYGPLLSPCEPFTVNPATPVFTTQVATTANPNVTGTTVASGTATFDTAVVAEVTPFAPAGTVTYNFFSNGVCSGAPTSTQTVTLAGGTVPNSTSQTLANGTYSYADSYSGDPNYQPATSVCEPFAVGTVNPTLTTQVNVNSTTVALGTTIFDTATLGPVLNNKAPIGSVTYSFFSNGTCSGTTTSTQTVTLSAGAVPNSSTQTPPAGSYSYRAAYSGDVNTLALSQAATASGVVTLNFTTSVSTVTTTASSTTVTVPSGGFPNVVAGMSVTGTGIAAGTTVSLVSGNTLTLSLAATARGIVTLGFTTTVANVTTTSGSTLVTVASGGFPNVVAGMSVAGTGIAAGTTVAAVGGTYQPATSSCEPFAVATKAPNFATQVDNSSNASVTNTTVALGTTTFDTATVSEVLPFVPAGSVTYSFFTNGTCIGAPTGTESHALSGGVVPNSSPLTLQTGNYSYNASYSGDINALTLSQAATASGTVTLSFTTSVANVTTTSASTMVTVASGGFPNVVAGMAVSGTGIAAGTTVASVGGNYQPATGSCEPFSVGQSAPNVTTQVKNSLNANVTGTTVASGTTTFDTANVPQAGSIAPTGSLTYSFFSNGTCAGTPTSTQVVTLSAGSVPNSTSQTLTNGTYSYADSYSGDASYLPATTSCEPFAVAVNIPTVTTKVETAGGVNVTNTTVALGTGVFDTSTLAPELNNTAPTGTVTYSLFSNGTCAGTPTSTQTVSLVAGAVPNSSSHTLGAGSYAYEAAYSGDSKYQPVTGSCEPFAVGTFVPTVVTRVHNSSNSDVTNTTVALGTATFDTASVSQVSPFIATGTATYSFFSNSTCTGVATSSQTVTLSAGAVPNSSTQTLGAGGYSYQASYSGDINTLALSQAATASGTVTLNFTTSVANVTTTSASTTVTVASGGFPNVVAGMSVAGTGIAAGTTVSSVSGNSLTLSLAATASGTVTLSFTTSVANVVTTLGSILVTVASGGFPSVVAGMSVAGTGIAAGTLVVVVGGNYQSAAGSCETFAVTTATPSFTTQVATTTNTNITGTTVVSGTATFDTAKVPEAGSIVPTGTVTYNFFSNGVCLGTPTSTQTVTLSAGSVPNSSTQTLANGTYSYLDAYSGDVALTLSLAATASGTVALSFTTTVANVTTTLGSPTVTVASGGFPNVVAGMSVSGTGITAGTTVVSVAGNSLTLSQAATATGTVTVSFTTTVANATTTSASTLVTVASGGFPNVVAGMSVSGTGIAASTTVASVGGNYQAVTGTCEPFAVAINVPTLTTRVVDTLGTINNTTVPLGTTVEDVVTLGPQLNNTALTGSVTYSFFSNGTCTGTATSTQTVSLVAGTVPNSASQVPGAGSYSYEAAYSGDTNYQPATGSCEPFAVATGTPTLTTQVVNSSNGNVTNTAVTLGTTISDSSAVSLLGSFAPTGSVTYSFFSNGTCTGTATSTQTVSLVAGTVPNSTSQTLPVGSYSYKDSYSGDINTLALSQPATASGTVTLSFTTTVANVTTTSASTTVTVASGGFPGVAAGMSVTGTGIAAGTTVSSVSGNTLILSLAATASGTVTLSFTTTVANVTTTSGSTLVTVASGGFPGVAAGMGVTGTGIAAGTTVAAIGGNYNPATSSCEPFSVGPNTPALITQVENSSSTNVTGTTVASGTATFDSVTVPEIASFVPAGTATYNFFSNGLCAGTPGSSQTVTLSGGAVPNSTSQTLANGTYSYSDSYSGDPNYKAASSQCEPFAVGTRNPTVNTQIVDRSGTSITGTTVALGTTVHDTATIGPVLDNDPITGSVTYSFFANGICSGVPQGTQAVSISGGLVPDSAVRTPPAGAYSYQASYSGDSHYQAATSRCEAVSVAQDPPTLTTQVDDSSGAAIGPTVPLGTIIFDTATIHGQVFNFTVNSDIEITATAPAGSGVADVEVSTAGGTSPTVRADQFSYVPIVSSVSPGSGPPAGGTAVTITGSNFTGATAVDFGTTPAPSFTMISDTEITTTAPAGTGMVDVVVLTPGGSSPTSTADQFSYAPVVASISPTSGPATGGTTVTISGSNFTSATAVNFGANLATTFSVDSDIQITAVSPPGRVPAAPVTVTSPGGTSDVNSAATFSYGPVVASVLPTAGVGSGGTKVVILGSDLKGATAVNFGTTVALSFSVKSANKIVAISPAGTGIVDVTVTGPGGTSPIVPTDTFNYAPTLTSIAPIHGRAAGGNIVIIRGTNFTGVTGVNFGTNAATKFTVVSKTKVRAVSPAGSGTVDVTVVSLGGTSPTTLLDQFTYG
jgi:hypothetical protein